MSTASRLPEPGEPRDVGTFFLSTFLWSWLIRTPLVLAGRGVVHLGEDLLAIMTFSALSLGACGPALGAYVSIWRLEWRSALRPFLIGTVGLSFFFSWVLKASGGRPLAALVAHGTYNAFIALCPPITFETDAVQTCWWIHGASRS